MRRPWSWRPSELPDGSSIMADCDRPDCLGRRYLPRAYLIEKVGDIPLFQIEPRLRCVERPRLNRRGAACGARMTLAFTPVPVNDKAGIMEKTHQMR